MTRPCANPLDISKRSNRLSFVALTPTYSWSSIHFHTSKNSSKQKTPLFQQTYKSLIVPKLKRNKKKKLDSLPVEILFLVLSHLSQSDVRNFMLTNKTLYKVCIHELYRKPHVTSSFKCSQFISLLKWNHFENYVRILDLSNLRDEQFSASWSDWNSDKTTKISRPFHKDLPIGRIVRLLDMCISIASIDFSGLPLPPDYFIHSSSIRSGGTKIGVIKFVSDVSENKNSLVKGYKWNEHEISECTAKHLFESMGRLKYLRYVAMRDTIWVSRLLLQQLLQDNKTIEYLDLRNAGMVKNAAWAVQSTRGEIIALIN